MTSILRQENGELFIYRSEKEFPKLYTGEDSDLTESKSDHDLQIAFWFSSSERIKVAEGEGGKFQKYLHDKKPYTDFKISEGIEIPESCYEVREKAGVYGMTNKGNQYFPGESLAYFKDDRASEKETRLVEQTKNFTHVRTEYVPDWVRRFNDLGEEIKRHFRESDRPHENTSLDPKEHAIEFAEWISKEGWNFGWASSIWTNQYDPMYFDGRPPANPKTSEQLYNQFINRK